MEVAQLISSAADCTIKTFMKCKFDKDFSGLVVSGSPTDEEIGEAWENINAEFLDLSGTEVAEIGLMKDIHELTCRVESAKAFFLLQHIWLAHFDEPPAPALKAITELRKYGYRFQWNGDKADFQKQLDKFELKEKKKHVELERRQKELEDFYKAEDQAESNPAVKKTIRNSRVEFVTMITDLQKFGYPINREITTVEELAIMYKEYRDYCAKAVAKN